MTTINTANISPVDALWALYQSQSKANKKKFRSLLAAEDAQKEEAVKAVCYVSLSSKAEKEMREDSFSIILGDIELINNK